VIVVGAGPAGAVLAYLLATRGVRTVLLERQHDFAREFRGEGLAPSAVELLPQLGIDAALAKVPMTVPTAIELYLKRHRVFRLEVGQDIFGDQLPTIVSQPAFLEAVVAEAQRSPELRFVRGATVRELLTEDGRVVGARVKTPEGEEKLRADLVIGCDGRASVVRRAEGFEIDSEELPMDVVWAKMPAPASYGDDRPVRACIGRGHLLITYVAYDGCLQLAWIILKGSFGDLRKQGVEKWIEELAHHCPPDLSDHLRANSEALVHPFLLSTGADHVRRWSIPGALVIGDAAHTMSPVGGQGLNLALRDAVVAANQLVPVLQKAGSDADVDAAAARVEELRGPEIDPIQRLAAVPPRVVMGRRFYHTWARALVTHLVGTSFGRRRAAPIALTFLEGVTNVSLEV
jgi:2-polyprenyl-6-methoxyphenol hydroxylase-like FAD-dependent oxidoreductase